MIDELNNQITCHKCNSKNIYISRMGNVDEVDEKFWVNDFFGEPYNYDPFGPYATHGYFDYDWEFTCAVCGASEVLHVRVSNLGGAQMLYHREPESLIEVKYSVSLKEPLSFHWLAKNREFEICKTHKFIRFYNKHFPPGEKLSDYPFGVYELETNDGYCRIEALPDEDEDKNPNWHKVKWYLVSIDNNFYKKVESGKSGDLPIRKKLFDEINVNVAAYELIYKLENQLRWLIYDRLSEKYRNVHGDKWWEATVADGIREKAKGRLRSEQDNPYMKVKKFHPIFYCDFPDLLVIVRKEWNIFKDDFKYKEIFQGKFRELQSYRNMIAHNRALAYEQLVEVKKNINQIYSALGKVDIELF